MIKRYLLNFLIFLAVIFIQIYFGATSFPAAFLNLVLIFLIFTFFNFPFYYLFILISLAGIVFDTISGFAWGTHFALLILCFGIGYGLMNLFEKSYFSPKLIMGNTIILAYFLGLLILNLVFQKLTFNTIILEQLIFSLVGYTLLCFLTREKQTVEEIKL
ncbi:MAG: hypothetical protein PHF45_01795 [Candidatus Pacebacteria bacterium]|nr:hypothetical protein [Candidatus Paceibacterota bacterium]